MSMTLPNGIIISIGTAYGVAKAISGISNGSPGVATSTGHALDAGTVGILTSGWNKLNDRVMRIIDPNANTFKLDGMDTANTTLFPVGTGNGSFKPVTTWVQVQQVTESATEGGEQQFTEVSFLENDFSVRMPTTKSAMGVNLTIADDPKLPGYQALKAASDDRQPRAIRFAMPDGGFIYHHAYVSFNEVPTMTKGNVMSCSATLSLLALPVRYTA